MFLEIHCDLSHHGLFGALVRRVHWVGKWHEIHAHHQLPSSSEVHFHPDCSTPYLVCCVAACVSKFRCWHLVVVIFSVTGVQLGSLCTAGCPVDLGHFLSLSLYLQ